MPTLWEGTPDFMLASPCDPVAGCTRAFRCVLHTPLVCLHVGVGIRLAGLTMDLHVVALPITAQERKTHSECPKAPYRMHEPTCRSGPFAVAA
jgi:hypothetical protein